MTILIVEKNERLQDGWSVADCPWCDKVQPARLEKVIRVVYFYCLPIGREVVGRAQRCDFCEYDVDDLLSIYQLNIDEWSHAAGVETLFGKLGVDDLAPVDPSCHHCLLALLNSASERSSPANIDVTGSTLLGGFLGGLLGAVLGICLWSPLGPHTPLDQIGFIFAGLFGGILLGCVTGAMIVSLGMPARFAYRRLNRTVADYGIDPLMLQALAGRHSKPVRRAVRWLQESAGGGSS